MCTLGLSTPRLRECSACPPLYGTSFCVCSTLKVKLPTTLHCGGDTLHTEKTHPLVEHNEQFALDQ